MAVKKKVAVSKIQKNNVYDTVKKTLESDKNNAYTVMGLMIEKFGVKEEELDRKAFFQWKAGHPSLYTRVRTSLEKLRKEGIIEKSKDGRAYVYYWKR